MSLAQTFTHCLLISKCRGAMPPINEISIDTDAPAQPQAEVSTASPSSTLLVFVKPQITIPAYNQLLPMDSSFYSSSRAKAKWRRSQKELGFEGEALPAPSSIRAARDSSRTGLNPGVKADELRLHLSSGVCLRCRSICRRS
jgi:hypothetical protein